MIYNIACNFTAHQNKDLKITQNLSWNDQLGKEWTGTKEPSVDRCTDLHKSETENSMGFRSRVIRGMFYRRTIDRTFDIPLDKSILIKNRKIKNIVSRS